MSEYDASFADAMTERSREAREEQDELDREHGQHILDITADQRSYRGGERLVDAILRAYQAKAEDERR
jgi:hypothetical protein